MGRRLTPEEQETIANGLIALTCALVLCAIVWVATR